MKKTIAILLLLSLTLFCAVSFVGCSEDSDSITVIVPDGGPALGMAYLMKNHSMINGVKINYEIKNGADDIKAAVMNGKADIAIMPTNLAAALYNNKIEIKLVATNSYGLMYLITNQGETTLSDLVGEVLHTVGKSGTPEAVLKKVLDSASIAYEESDTAATGKVALNFYSDGTQIIQKIAQGSIKYALLGEPAVSTALAKNSAYSIQIDLQEEWKTATNTDASYPQTALVVKTSLLNKNPGLVEKIAMLTLDGSYALKSNATPYVTYLKQIGATVPPTLGTDGVQRANITPAFGLTAKTDVSNYLSILYTFNAKLIGNKMPDDGFYYLSDELSSYTGK